MHLSVSYYIIFLGIYVSWDFLKSISKRKKYILSYLVQGSSAWTQKKNIQKEAVFIVTAATSVLLPSLKQSKCLLQNF